MRTLGTCALATGLLLVAAIAAAAPPSVEAFADRAHIEDAALSPDGQRLAVIETFEGRGGAVVIDRERAGKDANKLVLAEPEHFKLQWCHWATNVRLLCGFRAMTMERGIVYAVTRLAAVDADGSHPTVLLQNSLEAQGPFQDRIINWRPGIPDTVLIEADEKLDSGQIASGAAIYGRVGTYGFPAVFELNVVTGRLNLRQRAREPVRHWITDSHGDVRIGWGFQGTMRSYYARLEGDRDWRQLTKFKIFSRGNHPRPIAISGEDPNKAYVIADSEGRDAVWLVDLKDRDKPSLVFAHPLVDVSQPVLARDGSLIGVAYQTDYPMMFYTNEQVCALIERIKLTVPYVHNSIAGSSEDDRIVLIRSSSDIDAPTYRIFDTSTDTLSGLGAPHAAIPADSLAHLRSIEYPARDGTRIPGYLTVPHGSAAAQLPLIVMPHGGPIARDSWRYDFLREFLASRGYAVLQMNFRGSSGYGSDWFFAAHQDWGGLTYEDVLDGARWAIKEGIADPKRVCVVGWSFGGYIALVGAQRNPDVFRCAVDIAGVSDLSLLSNSLGIGAAGKLQIGTDSEKLKRDSPRQHADAFQVPLLMIHGDRDAQVQIEQSEVMDRALTKAGKAHRFIKLRDADHQLSTVADRVTMLHAVEAFLAEHLPPTAPPAP